MNTEERHRLNTNELGVVVQNVGHRLEEHATKIVAAICAVLLISAAVVWWSRQSSATAVKAWSLLETAENVNDFGAIADDYKGTPAGRWAKLKASELYLKTGLEQLFTDREVALQDLKKAREGFEELSNDKDQAIQERSLWGLALVLESTSDGDTSKAVEAYQRLLNTVPETYFKPFAEDRVATLKKGGASEFYAWFSKQNPKPTELRPKDGAVKSELDKLLHPDNDDAVAPPLLQRPAETTAPESKKDAGEDAAKPEADAKFKDAPAEKDSKTEETEKPKPEEKSEPKPEEKESGKKE
jgi:hypothetical protein